MPFQNSREQLKRLILERSVRHGVFRLASGLSTDVYIDGKPTTCSAAGTKLVGKVFLDKIEELGWNPSAVGGLVIGADPIVIAIACQSAVGPHPIDAFLVRKAPKPHGLQRFIEGIEDHRIDGLQVVIVDDVCTTGESTAMAISHAREAGMRVLGALCLVDREMGAIAKLTAEMGCAFDSIFKLSEILAAEERNAIEPATASVA